MPLFRRWVDIVILLFVVLLVQPCKAGRKFTVRDEIGLSHFGDPYTLQADAVQFSPDGRYFAVDTERGRLDLDRPECTIRIYRTQEIMNWLSDQKVEAAPLTRWTFSRSTDRDGPIITHWRWLADSSGIAFLERIHNGNQLVLGNLTTRRLDALTPPEQAVTAFDIRDAQHYIYAVRNPAFLENETKERSSAAIVGTGRSLPDLLFPADEHTMKARWADSSILWAVVKGSRFQVREQGKPIQLFDKGLESLALSPDGRLLVTALPVPDIPVEWTTLYPPPFPSSPFRLKPGHQNLETFMGYLLVSRYVLIDLSRGSVAPLLSGPTSDSAGWLSAFARPSWSTNGKEILVPGAFVGTGNEIPNRPCIAVLTLSSNKHSCVEMLKAQTGNGQEDGYHLIVGAHFIGNENDRVTVIFNNNVDSTEGTIEYQQADAENWRVVRETPGKADVSTTNIDLQVSQGLNTPPVLVATDRRSGTSRVLLDPNPQLRDIDFGTATTYKWKDRTGRDWVGGLYEPSLLIAGRRYPLVIQTHGFIDNQFRPSGLFPTAFAARELAASGILVLQIPLCPIFDSPEEVSCNVNGYEAAVAQLTRDGLIDPEKIGIVGFSRTCLHVMSALADNRAGFEAASLTDGVTEDYFQYLASLDLNENIGAKSLDAIVGGPPFGADLRRWTDNASSFKLNAITTPLLIVGEGPQSLLFMWGPYAALRYLGKPVDLIMLTHQGTHILTNPGERMISQGSTVDWFRFWLQGYEDPDPRKTKQYARWRTLRGKSSAALTSAQARQPTRR